MTNKEEAAILVRFPIPEGMTKSEAKEFVEYAVRTCGGQYFPGNENNDPDPRFLIGNANHSIKVAFYRRIR